MPRISALLTCPFLVAGTFRSLWDLQRKLHLGIVWKGRAVVRFIYSKHARCQSCSSPGKLPVLVMDLVKSSEGSFVYVKDKPAVFQQWTQEKYFDSFECHLNSAGVNFVKTYETTFRSPSSSC
jgi:hypothetical protein